MLGSNPSADLGITTKTGGGLTRLPAHLLYFIVILMR
jgi:hypothetical protein